MSAAGLSSKIGLRLTGRGADENPKQRFTALQWVYDEGEELEKVATKVFRDHSSSIISRNDSPDLGMDASVNPYRGCEHGCAYCYARPTHEYLGFGAGLDFESKIMAKLDAPALLRKAFLKPKYRPVCMTMSGVTDCYQPIEKKLRITRGCLEVCAEFRHPVAIITKNHLVTRDIDVLVKLAQHDAAMVYISLTSLDSDLAHKLEPRASSPAQRLQAVRMLSEAGVPVGVSLAPMIPGLNDHEMPSLLEAAAEAGAMAAFYSIVRLPFGVKEVFSNWLEAHFPDARDKILSRIEDAQGKTMSHPEFGKRLTGQGFWAEHLAQLFRVSMARFGFDEKTRPSLSAASFRRPVEQMEFAL